MPKNRIGEKNINNQGLSMEIIEYNRYTNITILFEDGFKRSATYSAFVAGNIKHPNFRDRRFIDRTGETIGNASGLVMKIIGYRSCRDIDIEFINSGYKIYNTTYSNFKSGNLKDFLSPCIYGIGYLGDGKYRCKEKDKKDTTEYSRWYKMMNRCYNEKTLIKHPTYIGCSVDKEWYDFQNFAKWFNDNLWTKEEPLQLDKDILIKGNKIYSSSNCVLVPPKINSLFTKREKDRGLYPIGVSRHKANGTYIAVTNDGNGNDRNGSVYLGSFDTPTEAFNAYKQFKESYIKQVADDYASKYPNFPKRLYDAMYNYEVEITD